MVRIVHGMKIPQMVRNVYGTKSLWYEKSGSPSPHPYYTLILRVFRLDQIADVGVNVSRAGTI